MNVNLDFNQFFEIDWRPLIPLLILFAILSATALYDLYKNRAHRKQLPIWTLGIIFLTPIGSILYFIFGRKG
ncbi:PLDc N-terminal domain-containing protein [Isobaculum melis]|uniref:Phospholipase_D-nuclease N-terminal n=1 Tax=Isobaculum melis TaxID=142588 RepID=A0A1H9TVE5_9LACT|nr:PLDc N-terminal domain-containing protein [Isobaculum melis]SES01156.1 Phospholipase_D-nuclease N-terminal [Isobaculum melis]